MSQEKQEYEGSTEDVVEILETRDRDENPVMPTNTIAEQVPVTKRTVINRLQGLKAAGTVEVLDLGNHKAWYLSTDRFLAGDESPENIATDGALPPGESDGTAELLETLPQMYRDNMRYRAQWSKTVRSAAKAIVPFLLAVPLAIFGQSAPAISYLQPAAGFLFVVSLVAGVSFLYNLYDTDIPEPPGFDEDNT